MTPVARLAPPDADRWLLQATSLSIPIGCGSIGVDLGLIRPEKYVARVAAGLVSVIACPIATSILTARSERDAHRRLPPAPVPGTSDPESAATT